MAVLTICFFSMVATILARSSRFALIGIRLVAESATSSIPTMSVFPIEGLADLLLDLGFFDLAEHVIVFF